MDEYEDENTIYENEKVDAMLEDDEIDANEEAFMKGYNDDDMEE
jgi:hypothetical protein|tara:strand:- start:1292 stop:1423 length:132 start_codon:yes stop_codon:yes gene_type:complete